MTKGEYSPYQKSVISGYYNNLDTIMLQKLSELVSELYMAETQAKRDRLWDRAHKAMVKLKVPPAILDHIMQKKDVQILAKNLQDWVARASRPWVSRTSRPREKNDKRIAKLDFLSNLPQLVRQLCHSALDAESILTAYQKNNPNSKCNSVKLPPFNPSYIESWLFRLS